MPSLEEIPALCDALRGETTPKFLATRSPEGEPNVVPCLSLTLDGDRPGLLFFGNFLLRKSIRNLERDGRVGILVVTAALRGWALCADFVEFQRTGPYVERQNSAALLRYNAYTGIRNAGLVQVRAVAGTFVLPRWRVARDAALTRLTGLRRVPRGAGDVVVPLPVRREFFRLAAVKVLAWVGEGGYPCVVPALSMQPAGPHALVTRLDAGMGPPTGSPVAANVLTTEAISYQAKGRWERSGRYGILHVERVFAGGPPFPGGRVA